MSNPATPENSDMVRCFLLWLVCRELPATHDKCWSQPVCYNNFKIISKFSSCMFLPDQTTCRNPSLQSQIQWSDSSSHEANLIMEPQKPHIKSRRIHANQTCLQPTLPKLVEHSGPSPGCEPCAPVKTSPCGRFAWQSPAGNGL